MTKFIVNNSRNKLILFIHGFTGDNDTWLHPNGCSFGDLIASEDDILENFDVATYSYFTKLTNTQVAIKKWKTKILSLFPSVLDDSKSNVSINEIAELLIAELRFNLKGYSEVVVVAHSMGGLITKSALVNDKLKSKSPVKLFVSLAVPHLGVESAVWGKLISPNAQIQDLSALSPVLSEINLKWVKTHEKPTVKYLYAVHDEYVTKDSACGIDHIDQDCTGVDHNHTSICKPKDKADGAYQATISFIRDYVSEVSYEEVLEHQNLVDKSQYEDENFVLKLLLADVHGHAVTHSKELFLNAEFARKLFSSESDQKKLSDLYVKLRDLYKDSFNKHLGKSGVNATLLVSDVHDKIVEQDDAFLKSMLPQLNAIHKKGMLQQLANDLSKDIWWSTGSSVDALDQLKEDLANEKNGE